MTSIAPTLQAFFTDRLSRQRRASGHTVAAYRDTLRLLALFAEESSGKAPSQLGFEDLDASVVGAFLDHIEAVRHNSTRTRNARLAAIRSLFRYAAYRHPEHAGLIAQVLAIPQKRTDKADVCFLTRAEADALIAAPDRATHIGRRDHTMVVLALQCGLRVSELTALTRADVHLGTGAHISCQGKGRKHRLTPLTTTTVKVLKAWLCELPAPATAPLFATSTGKPLTRDAVARRLAKHAARAAERCPSLAAKKLSPHTLRHYVNGRVMWPGTAAPLVAGSRGLVPAT